MSSELNYKWTFTYQIVHRTFGTYRNQDKWKTEASKLHGLLNADGISDSDLNLDLFYAVGYDSPMRFFKRRNEVWILKVWLYYNLVFRKKEIFLMNFLLLFIDC